MWSFATRTSAEALGFNQATVGLPPRLADPNIFESFLMLMAP